MAFNSPMDNNLESQEWVSNKGVSLGCNQEDIVDNKEGLIHLDLLVWVALECRECQGQE